MQDEEFESLEKANAQWDIWIDQEEYGKIDDSIQFEGPVDLFKKAFDHDHCTSAATNQWNELFQKRNLSSIVLSSWQPPITLDSNWIPFFWAKFIRAKIQEKGTDCYFRRLDQQVLFYLERSLPEIISQDRDSAQETRQKIKLTVLYLLEMAAAGTGPDQRSFAERARRILKEHFAEKDFFNKFYELLARYNIGVGFQHEGQKRKAVQEFNYIIYNLKDIYDIHESGLPEDKKEWKKYADHRNGLELIYIPALFMRAAIQVKLQLAYHAIKTLILVENLIVNYPKHKYIKAKVNIQKAEAYRLIGDFPSSEECLKKIKRFICNDNKLDPSEISRLDIKRYPNITGRFIDILVALRLDQMRSVNRTDADGFCSLLKKYWDTARFSSTNREGYLLLTAEILAFLAEKKDSIYSNTLKKIYEVNREPLLEVESHRIGGCIYCDTKGIDLRKMSSKHYEDFRKHISDFFKRYDEDPQIPNDKKELGNRLIAIEKEREDLEWRKRQIDYLLRDTGDSSSWCESCVPKQDSGFIGLLACRKILQSPDGGEIHEKRLTAFDYEHIMDNWDKHFLDHLQWRTVHQLKSSSLHFLGLQRWNSTSPAQGRSVGGGYLLYHTDGRGKVDLGIAIDPGFDFVRNLFHAGFSLSDIDLVLLSHAHIDHVRDFESMVTLFLELEKRSESKEKRRPHVIMTLGIYHRLAHIIESPALRKYLEPYIVDIGKELGDEELKAQEFDFTSNKNSKFRNSLAPVLDNASDNATREMHIKVKPIIAYHNDFSEYSDSFGFRIEITTQNSSFCLGYTGDTSWHSGIMDNYRDCDALLVHLGSLIDREKKDRRKFSYYSESEKCWEIAIEKNHPYLMGMLHFFRELQKQKEKNGEPPLVLMGEFGEELRGRIRLDLIERLRNTFKPIRVLPVDVGLDVLLSTQVQGALAVPSVLCVICNEFIKLENIEFETYGHDEALFCVCRTCWKSTPMNVLQERLKTLSEVGRRLQKEDAKEGTK